MFLLLSAVGAIALCYYTQMYYNSNICEKPNDCFFSETFEESRTKWFAAMDKHSNVEKFSLPVVEDLNLDIALFRGKTDQAYLHVAGTHGAEGYAGCAVQLAVLKDLKFDPETMPTLVFVHGLNPYGMKYNRRVNEDNIDLNRNYLTPEEFEFRKNNPNIAGYMDYDFNPVGTKYPILNLLHVFYIQLQTLYQVSFDLLKIKTALVSSQYHMKEGVQFGGFKRAASHTQLDKFLTEQLNVQGMRKVWMVDVHTGLGPYGADTLMTGSQYPAPKIFTAEKSGAGKLVGLANNQDSTSAGYEKVVGLACGHLNIFSNALQKFEVTQEFGTIPSVLVGALMISDNVSYQSGADPASRGFLVRRAFHVKSNIWEKEVVRRGKIVFKEVLDNFSHELVKKQE